MNDIPEGELRIESENDIVAARKVVRRTATAMGFGITDVTRIVTAASELSRNVYQYAHFGTMRWRFLNEEAGVGLELVFEDSGPGISDIGEAMRAGFSTSRGLGLGLPGVKRLMDAMTVQSQVGRGTTVKVRKWLRRSYAAAITSGGDPPQG
ncbi:MAG: anti-sigma regulatory factor [Acidobacteriota bacterium]|jgi:serine/threonine-protein kinase RsbT